VSGRAGRDPDLRVKLGALEFRHPVVNASGTYEADPELVAGPDGFPFSAYFPKTVTLEPRGGNPPPRITETPSGVINAIGLDNPGVEAFLDDLDRLHAFPAPIVVSVGGGAASDYGATVERLERHLDRPGPVHPPVCGYELNVSCPNVASGIAIGADPGALAALVAGVRPLTERLLVVKLTPNVGDVVAPALAAEEAGADAVSLVNTFRATVLDRDTLRPFLGNRTGGLCGPAIRPIALRMVAEVAAAVEVPVIGMGGITSGQDALEFIACGATLVGIGVAVFADPEAPRRIVAELADGLRRRGFARLDDVRGTALE